uniref:Uncharacterized protein n=1 Tax=Accipiter nisus TaxID=211598 RepID=A0A8B9M698_9AVES
MGCPHPCTPLPLLPTLTRPSFLGGRIGGPPAGVALVGIPAGIWALGFTGTGVAAGSVAAKMMSAAAVANNGGVAAGSVVSVLQSVGAAGFSLGSKIGLTTTLGPLGAAAGAKLFKGKTTPGDNRK